MDCACGLPLHYSSAVIQGQVEEIIDALGPLQRVTVEGEGTWMVPRHFIALHGLKAPDLPVIAVVFGFEKVG